ncbi:hypothetical protein [Laribacter hongkongensis]|uniref:hypothetical protein n=1 Tax=Laribacter hongkongensis TaxID=168471 RepID=UPI001EFDC221|nr:hypothetical protein [Laribacter hongkongensis]MCG9077929.1 hypothetical protein [Laribacter hongkongensis]
MPTTAYYANSAAKLPPAVKLLPITATDRPSRVHDNSLVAEHLSQYLNFTDFMRDAPGPFRAVLDDVITGASRLDLGGNSRPLGKVRLFTLLAHLPATTAEAFQCPDRHARKIAAVLRVASMALHEWIVRHMEMDAAGEVPQGGSRNHR